MSGRYLIVIEHRDGDGELPALRRLLKRLARGYGFRCVRIERAPRLPRPAGELTGEGRDRMTRSVPKSVSPGGGR